MRLPSKFLNFHLPLSPETHALLREEAERAGVPATSLAREALERWLREKRREELANGLRSYAADMGSLADLDEELEAASADHLADEPEE